MERRIASLASPLSALRTLESNLKRERRVFGMLIALLAFAGLCAAGVAALSIGAASLATQTTRMGAVTVQTNELLLRRFNMLESMRLLLGLHELDLLPLTPADKTEAPLDCTPAFNGLDGSPELRTLCERAVQLVARAGADAPMLFVLLDGSAAWSHRLAPGARQPGGAASQSSPEQARMLADAVLLRMNTRGIDPLGAGRWKKITWFKPPAGLGFAPSLVLAAATVLKDEKPIAVVLTSVDLNQLPRASNAEDTDAEAAPILFDRDGAMLSGPLPAAVAQYVDREVASLQPDRFHLLPRFGWVMHGPPLESEFGHYTLAISLRTQLALIGVPLAVIALMTLALLALLAALARYWSRHVLERTYAEATRALEGELLNHLLVHATPVGLCIVRQRNFEIVVANQIVRNVLGLDAKATRLPSALSVEFEKRMPYAPPADGEMPIYDLPFSLTREDGQSVHLDITFAPATMRREDVMFCAFADMSKHYEAERLLREAKRTSDEAARSKVSFFAAMSHEIRTPLASLTGNIELLARGALAPEQQARVQAMQISASELLQIVSDVLDFSKIDVGAMTLSEESESIAALLVRIALAHAPLAVRQQLPFYLVIDRAIPARLHFDPVRLAQIVNNILSNAFKFTHSGKIVLRANWRDDTLEISVADSGVGMPESLKARLFQPFTQGDAHRLTEARGTGLGLSICGRLAKLMHGSCEIESTLGVGTRVIVTLPLQTDASTTAGEEWTLPDARAAILCRAPENREWLTNLFDPQSSAPTDLASAQISPASGALDYLLVTGEYTIDDVQRLWNGTANVVWLRQDGPLVPVAREDGSVEVSLYSLAGIRIATQMLRMLPEDDAVQQTPPVIAAAHEPQQASEFQRLNVLIAEDNLLNRSLLRDQLRTLGANVIEAKDGEEALARLDTTRIDAVLTDLNMPRMNGLQLLHAARARHATLPVYAISGNALPEQIAQGRQSGFTDYLSKPVPLAALARVLADVAAQTQAPAQAQTPPEFTDDVDDETGIPRFPALAPPIAPLFIEQADHDIADYARIQSTHDLERLRDWAHRVSGGLAVLGPSMLYETSLELRATLRESDQWAEDIDELSRALAQELEALREHAASQLSA